MPAYRPDVINQFHHWQPGVDLRRFFVAVFAHLNPGVAVPTDTIGTVRARVDWGRWLVDCPTGCGGAAVVDVEQPTFLCVNCGSGWYAVEFPANREAIEQELLRRAPGDPGRVRQMGSEHRNWKPGETEEDLRREFIRYGLGLVLPRVGR